MSSRGRKSLAAWIFATVVGGLIGACVIEPEEVHGPCTQDSDCPDDDANPCTRGVCNVGTGFCSHQNQDLPLGDTGCDDKNPCTAEYCDNGVCAFMPQDLPFGDTGCDDKNACTDDYCSGGACAHKDSSAQPDDGNECTADSCMGGMETHTPVADGIKCGLNDALECTNGKCACTSATECGVSTECLKFDCTMGSCSSMSLAAGTLVDNVDATDCFKRVCDGNNMIVIAPDPTEVPPDPTTGNCQKKACDDMGNVVDVDDPGDIPADDNNVCTMEGCNGGMVIDHVPVADGTTCGMGPSCGPVGGGGYVTVPQQVCTAGACTTPANVACGSYKCDPAGTACLSACAMDGDCIAGNYCDGAANACKPVAGTGNPCSMQSQCAMGLFCVDGFCCNTQCNGPCEHCNDAASKGTCTASTSGTDPDNDCTDPKVCNGVGACASPNGTNCATAADCISGICTDGVCCNTACTGACNRCDIAGSIGTCTAVNNNQQVSGCDTTQACDGMGNCKLLNSQGCAANGDCLTGFCQDGYCCNSACAGACQACNVAGNLGTCTSVAAGQQPTGCNMTQACDGMGNCKKATGQSCSAAVDCANGFCADGFCCNQACTGTCKACAQSKTGSPDGQCANVTDKTDPDDECPPMGTCSQGNGNGCCKGDGTCY